MKWLAKRISPVWRGQGGISLIEVLISVVIIGVIAVVYIRAVESSTRATGQVDEQTVGKNLILTTIEGIREHVWANDYDDVVAGIPTPNQWEITATIDCTDTPTDDLSYADCTGAETWQRIYVTASREGETVLRICTYRTYR